MGYEEKVNANTHSANTTKVAATKMLQMPYGGQIIDSNTSAKMARSGQNSVQAMRNTASGHQNSTRLSPANKKRNYRGQMSSQMNKTTSVNDAKK